MRKGLAPLILEAEALQTQQREVQRKFGRSVLVLQQYERLALPPGRQKVRVNFQGAQAGMPEVRLDSRDRYVHGQLPAGAGMP